MFIEARVSYYIIPAVNEDSPFTYFTSLPRNLQCPRRPRVLLAAPAPARETAARCGITGLNCNPGSSSLWLKHDHGK